MPIFGGQYDNDYQHKYVCITTNLPNIKSNPNPNPEPNPTTKQHAVVNIQLNIVTCPTYPDKFIRYNVVAPLALLSIVIVALPFGDRRGSNRSRNNVVAPDTPFYPVSPMADPYILKEGGGAEDNVSAPSSFIANTHDVIYVFYTGKGALFKKFVRPIGGGLNPPLNRSTLCPVCPHSSYTHNIAWYYTFTF